MPKESPLTKRNATSGYGLLRHLCIKWNMASEDDHLHLSCKSSDFEEDKTLPENASKQYGLQPYQFEPYTAENGSTDDSSDQEETPVDCEHG